jgi:hypothetical protein
MKKAQKFSDFLHGNKCLKVTMCLLCTGGFIQPLFAISNVPRSLSTMVIQQSTMTIKGTVKDDKGEPVVGASIIEKGTTNGSITDLDGNYTLRVTPGAHIVVSYVGFVKQEFCAGKGGNITLREDSKTLSDVVVIGYVPNAREMLPLPLPVLNQAIFPKVISRMLAI